MRNLGIGEKTNVGYGKLNNISNYITEKEKLQIENNKKQAQKDRIDALSPIEKIFDRYSHDTTKIIQGIQSNNINEFDTIKIELAKKIKQELQKNPRTWERAKQKALSYFYV